ncbi:diacylglycerol/lipid kinase family protein [Intrasporangium calvum]|uniref:Diacylglycerol kinase catalytic region n=1 Tax=Intrasporangium calvum (strain ATCC 23552 / DSM 43043 / JCM 3097 / NBRC 12989 / NCIMB 10167 / NRRL B-3866 / 7 KIP) TaxID=710696 RepID=E6S5Z7_INTC7|nr:diacylglycerol kinase family protein [Intrasporangium calvum]ADU46737.1 diacylglycerol kinase catalytic region [Intrasporangium calvum DSM 43043]AXG15100.1 diacylglycerol kinase family lipid kinase [Intrasporangium calvum]
MPNDYLPWIIAGIVALALGVGVVLGTRTAARSTTALRRRRGRGRPSRDQFRSGQRSTALKRAAVVVNPTKFADLPMIHERITSTSHACGWGDPLFYETTVADPGTGQAERAVAEGASVVCSLGGDGTVRAVASGLIGTETPLGILPAGTGNLLARNLDLPVLALDEAVRVALTGRNRRIDVGEVVIGEMDAHGQPVGGGELVTQQFLVMAGMGLDALIMGGTNEALKQRVGWAAYLLTGFKHLVSPEFRTQVRLDAEPEFKRRARAVVIGNCGRLLGGLVLMPDARVDDQQLDVVIASPRGFVGWAPVIARVLTRQRKGHSTLDHKVCREIRVRVDHPLPVQVDGDVVGEATEINATVRPAALTVRVPIT